MNFIFEWLYDRAQRVSKILFLPRENKIHISSRLVMFFLLHRLKDMSDIDKK